MTKLLKVVDYTHPYISKKDGLEHPNTNFYLEFDNGSGRTLRVCIRPAFEKHIATDLGTLSNFADELRIIKDEKKEG